MLDYPDHDRFLPAALFRLGRELRTAVDRELAPHGLTAQQAAVLAMARHEREVAPARLAGKVGTDAAGISRLLDRLEAKHLVERGSRPDDRRSVVVRLTPEGEAMVPQVAAAFGSAQHRLLAGIPEAELKRFRATLGRLRENLLSGEQQTVVSR